MPHLRAARPVLPGALLAALLIAAPAAGAAGVRVTVSKGFAVSMTAAPKAVDQYDVNPGDDPSAFCRGGTPLTVGWTGARAPISGTTVYPARGTGAAYVKLDPRRPKTAGSLRAIAVCGSGAKVKATTRISLSGTTVGCGAKLTLGLAATESWPYIDTPITVGPSGANGWSAAAGPRPRPTAICVGRSAFTRVSDVRARGAFATGSATATVTASCPRGRRALAWGYEAAPIPGNTWRSAESRNVRSVPFVGDAVPTAGAKGFRVTFRTADDAGATAASPVTVHVRCGTPAG